MKNVSPASASEFHGNSNVRRAGLRVLLGLMLPVLATSASAASGTWLGGTSTDWNDAANWVGGNLPNGSTEVATLNADRTFDNPSLSANVSLQRLDILSGAPATTVSTSGGVLSVFGGLSTNAFIASNGASNILDLDVNYSYNNSSFNVTPTSSLTFAAGRTLTLNAVNSGFFASLTGGGTVNVNSNLIYNGLANNARTFYVGNGTLNFNAATITSGTTFSAMRMQVGGANIAGNHAIMNLQRSLTASEVSSISIGDNNTTSVSTLRIDGNGLNVASALTLTAFGSGAGSRVSTLALDRAGTNAGTFSGALSVNSVTANTGTVVFSAGQDDTLFFSGSLNTASAVNLTLEKTGAGTVVFSGSTSNVFGSGISINAGTLLLQKSGGATAVNTNLTVNASAELQLGAADQIANTSSLTLAGGALAASGFSDTLGSLVINGTGSGIDFGSGASILSFASGAYTSGSLTIYGWSESVDSWRFASDPTAFVNALGSNLVFDGFGSGGTVVDLGGGAWEVVAVPEPGTRALLLAGSALTIGMVSRRRRR